MSEPIKGRGSSPSAYLRIAPGMVWPDPTDPGDVGWKMNYEQGVDFPTEADRRVAASVFAAYRELVWMSERRRREVIRALRKAVKESRDV